MAQTSFDVIFDRMLHKIEKDRDFFAYYNVSVQEAQELIMKQIHSYLRDAIDLFVTRCAADMDINLYDIDEYNQAFNTELTQREIGILANLMYEVYLSRDEAMLKAMRVRMTTADLNRFSPAQERSTFMNMLIDVRRENEIDISKYASRDRLTGNRKKIDHSLYNYTE